MTRPVGPPHVRLWQTRTLTPLRPPWPPTLVPLRRSKLRCSLHLPMKHSQAPKRARSAARSPHHVAGFEVPATSMGASNLARSVLDCSKDCAPPTVSTTAAEPGVPGRRPTVCVATSPCTTRRAGRRCSRMPCRPSCCSVPMHPRRRATPRSRRSIGHASTTSARRGTNTLASHQRLRSCDQRDATIAGLRHTSAAIINAGHHAFHNRSRPQLCITSPRLRGAPMDTTSAH